MRLWQMLVDFFGFINLFSLLFCVFLLLIWLLLYILSEKYIIPERILYSFIRKTSFLMIVLIIACLISFYFKDHYQDLIDNQHSLDRNFQNK
ncbi:hypothetical protein [Staphylococcus caprae]|uniref:hypothetical protein n=1 Tax=Staphylococcus caprae TaxID=29380 RepID=UPI000E69BE60|nr:hypothetical protein [Staphylococcus caprae]RIM32847.1 hypothetical protein BU631_12485 [Staphylococcus caprae]